MHSIGAVRYFPFSDTITFCIMEHQHRISDQWHHACIVLHGKDATVLNHRRAAHLGCMLEYNEACDLIEWAFDCLKTAPDVAAVHRVLGF